jgi:hypothetical protein
MTEPEHRYQDRNWRYDCQQIQSSVCDQQQYRRYDK